VAKVLVVDDDEFMLALFRRILVGAGHLVEVTELGSDVAPLLESFHPDVVITDIFMPEVDGFEVIRSLRSVDATIGIIVISGNHLDLPSQCGGPEGPYYLHAAQCMGANQALRKPFTAEELLAAVDQWTTRQDIPPAPVAMAR